MSRPYIVVSFWLYLNLKLSSRKLSYFSDIWQAFDALMFLGEPKGQKGEGCMGLLYCFDTLRVEVSLYQVGDRLTAPP
jgi:hypothetical protein